MFGKEYAGPVCVILQLYNDVPCFKSYFLCGSYLGLVNEIHLPRILNLQHMTQD